MATISSINPVAKTQRSRFSWWPKSQMKRQEAIIGYLFILPLFLGFIIFLLGPMIASIYISFTEWDIITPMQYVGLENFKELFDDRVVGISFKNTFFLMLGIPIGPVISLILAMAMNRKMIGVRFFRMIYFLPVISSIAAVALLWRWIYNPYFGLMNIFLRALGVTEPPLWLGSPEWAKPALIIMGVWGGIGFNMLLFLAALQGVPAHLYDAAKIDGANSWQSFWNVTWPFITPTVFFIFVTSVIGTFQAFANINLMTRGSGSGDVGGGPRWATTTVLYYLWINAFNYYKMGYASSLAWLLAIVILIFTIIQFVGSRKWVFYGQ